MSEPPGAGTLDEIRRLIAGQAKLLAIKRYREATGAGLAEAKAAVERLQAEQARATLPAIGDGALAIGEALRTGHKIEAIRLYRAATGLGLKEAKDAIDAILAEKKAGPRSLGIPPEAGTIHRRRVSPMLILLALALIFGSAFGLVLLFSGK